jgi:hypothetical protein
MRRSGWRAFFLLSVAVWGRFRWIGEGSAALVCREASCEAQPYREALAEDRNLEARFGRFYILPDSNVARLVAAPRGGLETMEGNGGIFDYEAAEPFDYVLLELPEYPELPLNGQQFVLSLFVRWKLHRSTGDVCAATKSAMRRSIEALLEGRECKRVGWLLEMGDVEMLRKRASSRASELVSSVRRGMHLLFPDSRFDVMLPDNLSMLPPSLKWICSPSLAISHQIPFSVFLHPRLIDGEHVLAKEKDDADGYPLALMSAMRLIPREEWFFPKILPLYRDTAFCIYTLRIRRSDAQWGLQPPFSEGVPISPEHKSSSQASFHSVDLHSDSDALASDGEDADSEDAGYEKVEHEKAGRETVQEAFEDYELI